jgi:signal transduction histidine kinase
MACLVCALIIISQVAAGQAGDFDIHHYTSENGLPQNSIKGIERDSLGYLWLATEIGLARFDGSNFRLFNKNNTPVIKATRMSRMNKMADGEIYVQEEGDNYLLIDRRGAFHASSKPAEMDSINFIYSFYGRVLLNYYHRQAPRWAIPDEGNISHSTITCLNRLRERYFYFNDVGGLVSADTSFREFRKISVSGNLGNLMKSADFRNTAATLLPDGENFYLRWGPSLYLLRFSADSLSVSGEPVLEVGSISHINVCRYWPEQRQFILGTLSDGLYFFRRHSFSTLEFRNTESNVFYAQVPFGPDGSLTNLGMLSPENSIPMQDLNAESLLLTSGGHYFANFWKNPLESGIVEYDQNLKKVNYVPDSNLKVACFQEFHDGSIWIIGKNRFLGKIGRQDVKWIPRPASLPTTDRITTFIEMDSQTVLVGTERGVGIYHFGDQSFQFLQGLNGRDVRCFYKDRKGILWIGTYGNGFFAMYEGKLVPFPLDRENKLAAVHGFLEDGHGFCWITTNKGLIQVSMQDLYDYLNDPVQTVYYYYYDRSNGFETNEFNGGCTPSAIRLNNGKFSLPSLKGLVQFYPDSLKPVIPDRAIQIDEILLDNKIEGPGNTLHKIASGVGRIQIEVSSPYFGNTFNQAIEYRMKGLDSTWYAVNPDGIIIFNDLPAGNYRLELRKIGGFGKNNFIRREASFEIEPPFYGKLFFLILLGAGFVGLSFVVFRLRLRYLVRQKRKLEQEVVERTKEQQLLIQHLEESIEEVEVSKEELYKNALFKENLAMIVTHDLRSPLRFLHAAALRLRGGLASGKAGELGPLATELEKSSGSIARFVEDFSWWLSSMEKDFKIHPARVSALEVFRAQESFFRELLLAKSNELVIRAAPDKEIYTDRDLLTFILRNIVDNSNKNTAGGTIEAGIVTRDGMATIRIRDSGKGMSLQTLESLRKRIQDPAAWTSGGNNRFGYRFIIDFCKLLDIKLSIESVQGEGTTVSLSEIPLA